MIDQANRFDNDVELMPVKLSRVDLNLLPTFYAIAQERSLSAAAVRLGVGQSAISKALQRLRVVFHDDLIVRSGVSYELTVFGRRLTEQLEETLPALRNLFYQSTFDSETDRAVFRVAATDDMDVLMSPFIADALTRSKAIEIHIVRPSTNLVEDLEAGRIDLAIYSDDGAVPSQLHVQKLYDERMVCVVRKDLPWKTSITFNQYVKASHIVVAENGVEQSIPDRQLTRAGVTRTASLTVPHFHAALRCVERVESIATVPKLFASFYSSEKSKILVAPSEIKSFSQLMVWHPRMENELSHRWLRELFSSVAESVHSKR